MFYAADTLRRGGRFYIPWVADSYPERFSKMSIRQLRSQDIGKLCDELKEVVICESAGLKHRYSLRLSSQLLRGLTRLYQKQISLLLDDTCMVNANVLKSCNKRYNQEERPGRSRPRSPAPEQAADGARPALAPLELLQELDDEPHLEQILNNGNMVSHIQDITLREDVIARPELQPNEGFGEESAEDVLRFLSERRSVEQMLPALSPAAQHSAFGAQLDVTLPPNDARAPPRPGMEPLTSVLRLSDGVLLSVTDFGKEIPDIPEAPIPSILESPDPREMLRAVDAGGAPAPAEQPPRTAEVEPEQPTQIELEELEEMEPRAKRRRKLIIDKKIQIATDVLRARIQNPHIDTWLEEAEWRSEVRAVVPPRVSFAEFMGRPSCAGGGARSLVAPALTHMFMRNLTVRPAARERPAPDQVEAMQRHVLHHTRSPSARPDLASQRPRAERAAGSAAGITWPAPATDVTLPTPAVDITLPAPAADVTLPAPAVDITWPAPAVDITWPAPTIDVSVAPPETDMLAPAPVAPLQSAADQAEPTTSKAPSFGDMSMRENVQRERAPKRAADSASGKQDARVSDADKENVSASTSTRVSESRPKRSAPSSEPLLGSLDRTKVSLGDSDSTTVSRRFIRDQWCAQAIMVKILECMKLNVGEPITIRHLIARGPIIPEYKRIIIARCFAILLRLKQYNMIKIIKCPETLEILDIQLGPSFQHGGVWRELTADDRLDLADDD